MSSQCYPPEFKDEAVRQVLERGYTVAEVSQRLGVSAHSLYKWVKAVKPDKSDEQAAELVEAKSEILRLRAQMRRIEEKRDILKKAARYFAREPEQSTSSSMITGASSLTRPCYQGNSGVYGSPRVFLDLPETGETCKSSCSVDERA